MQIVSQVPAVGEVIVGSLEEMQGKSFDRPVVVLAQTLGGMEDIPAGGPLDSCDHIRPTFMYYLVSGMVSLTIFGGAGACTTGQVL